MLAALEGQLHVLGGLDLLHRAGHVQAGRVVGGVGLVGLGLDVALHHELVVVEVARVARHAEVVPHVLGAQALLAGHERLVELLAVAGAYHLRAHVPEHLLDRLGEVADGAGGCLLDEQVAGVGALEGELHQVHRLVEVHEEARHAGVGDRQGLALADSIDKQRDHAST